MKIFSPAIKLLNNIKYSKKFLVIGLILIIPLICVSFFYLKSINGDMHQIEERTEGAEFNLLLKDVLQNMQKSRGLNIKLLSDDSVKDSVNESNEKVNKAFSKIEKIEPDTSYEKKWIERTKKIKDKWETLQQTTWSNSEDILSEYEAAIAEVITLMSDVANDSGLMLATSTESFHLIYNNSIILPNFTEYLAQMRALGVSIINDHSSNKEEKLRNLNELYFPVQDTINDLQNSMAIVFNNKNFKSSLEPLYVDAINNTNTYLTKIDQIQNGTVSSDDYYDIATKAIDENFDFYSSSFDILVHDLEQQYDHLHSKVIKILIALIVVILAAIFLFISLYLAIIQSIHTLKDAAEKVANGNLGVTISLKTKDEMHKIEKAFNRMTGELKELVKEILMSAEQVASSSEELYASAEEVTAASEDSASAATQMAKNAEKQAVSMQESTEEIQKMAVEIKRISKDIQVASNLTNETSELANEGNSTVKKTFDQMEMIQDTVQKSSEKIEHLHKQSSEIDSIVRAITEIAEQTNLLALNAAIEAARAGVHGQSFAVVADEVRKLAEQSRSSANQIAELIQTVQNDVLEAVQFMNDVNENVAMGMQVTEETAHHFVKIVDNMKMLKPQVEEISLNTIELSTQTEHVASAVQELLDLSHQTSAATEEIAASSEEELAVMEEITSNANNLSKMAESLQQFVTQFKLQ